MHANLHKLVTGAVGGNGYCDASLAPQFSAVRERFLAAIDSEQRPLVEVLLSQPRAGGRGLRMWLRTIAAQESPLPESLPVTLVQVYLNDPEAIPLHDCAGCGIAVPIRPNCLSYEEEPAEVYFPDCPCCGSRTGLYASWAKGPLNRLDPVPAERALVQLCS
jgi:hypothetical protein